MWGYVHSKMAAVEFKSSGEGLEEEALVSDDTREYSDEEGAILHAPTNTLVRGVS